MNIRTIPSSKTLSKEDKAVRLFDAGNVDFNFISQILNVKVEQVTEWLGWRLEAKRHAKFFKGMSPRQEYTAHIKKRYALGDDRP